MASQLFKESINVSKLLKSLSENTSVVLEVSDGITFDYTQRSLQSYATRLKIKLVTDSLKAVSANDQVVRLVKITHKGLK
tara:strand:- start:10 stop:249 length:240 start_codon:yes stop_codon:yes gene_type:complete